MVRRNHSLWGQLGKGHNSHLQKYQNKLKVIDMENISMVLILQSIKV